MGDILLLRQLGTVLDRPSGREDAGRVRDLLAQGLLKVRNKEKRLLLLTPNL